MTSGAFRRCLLLVEKMVEHQYINQISQQELEKLIARYIGVDQRTKTKYVRACIDFELLKPHIYKKDEVTVYSINLVEADKAMREVYGRNLRQLTLFPPKE